MEILEKIQKTMKADLVGELYVKIMVITAGNSADRKIHDEEYGEADGLEVIEEDSGFYAVRSVLDARCDAVGRPQHATSVLAARSNVDARPKYI